MMGFFFGMLRAPDAQGDPYQWAAVLMAHAMIGVALAAVLPWWVVVGVYAVWEAVQWLHYGADVWDCVLDWCAVALGVCVAVALSSGADAVGAVLALAIVLAVGVRARSNTPGRHP